ncbi:DUF6328 family protein [Nocardioides sp. SYSU D00038]|uniref:DUF6328 family protein n=1 Tax=Nocardioides sp. SYSU D00038 TaxID=2812554 RepID=UPI001967B9FF|nr:DUF6328 family protein [Nocardioides sp. SYSU D00038]
MDPHPVTGRRETETERLDRKWDDLVQELRVMQTGAQLVAGILLTLPFQERFEELDSFQHVVYLCLVVLAALVTALVMTPVAIHRALSGRQVKQQVVAAAQRLVWGVITTIALLVVGMTAFVFDMVVDRTAAMVAGGSVGLVLAVLFVAVPVTLRRRGDRADDDT